MAETGGKAPDFNLVADDGTTVKLSKLKGRPVVVYFYPKDDTSGCTLEAQSFTALVGEFAAADVEVYGISPDTAESHCKFRDKYDLRIKLLADPDKTAAEAYGVWVEKSMYGKKYMGVERSTFLIGPDGRIARSWIKVKVPGHAEEVLEAARSLATGEHAPQAAGSAAKPKAAEKPAKAAAKAPASKAPAKKPAAKKR